MEYFRIVNVKSTEFQLQSQLTLANLDEVSTEIFNLGSPGEHETSIGGIWGEFTLNRISIKGGVRFALLECPNALCWTVTTGYPPEPESVVIHLTINRQEKNQEFIEEIIDFLDDHCENLKHFLSNSEIWED